MRILLTHPYILALDPREQALGRPYPPLGTLLVAAALQQAGHTVLFLDAMFFADAEALGRALVDQGAVDLIAIVPDDHAVPIKQCLSRVRATALHLLGVAHGRGVPVVVSGPDASDHPQVYRAAGATAVFRGEVVAALVEWCAPGRSAPVQGVVGEGGGEDAERRGVITDLDALPDVAWALCDLSPYAALWRRRHGVWELSLWTARGCPYRCNWCAKPIWGRSYHVRSPERVAAELHWIMERYGPDRVWFTDDIFGLRPAWLRAFRAALGGRTLPHRCLSRVDLLRDAAYVADLAATGCDQVWVGAESGSDRILTAMDKDSTVADIRQATRLLREQGVRVGFFLQLGYPGEGLAEVEATVRLVRELRPDEIGVSVSYPLPGTGFYERVVSTQASSSLSWSGSMENRPLFAAPFEDAFYAAAKEVLRSTHSAGHARAAVVGLLRQPDARQARRVVGALYHRARLPWAEAQMRRLAVPRPDAVTLPG